MFTRKVDVTIKRSIYETVHKDVFPYEIPILEELYGTGNIQEVPEGKEYPILEVDAELEFSRLQGVYERHLTVNVTNAEYVFGREGGAKIEADFDIGEYGPAHITGDVDQDGQSNPPEPEYEEMTKDRLHVLLDDRDISWGPNDNKAHLIALLIRGDHGFTDAAESGRPATGAER